MINNIKLEKSDKFYIVSGVDDNGLRRSLDIFTSKKDALQLINDINNPDIIVYRERVYITPYKCRDYIQKIRLYKTWISGGLLYGYMDRFNIKTISTENIINI